MCIFLDGNEYEMTILFCKQVCMLVFLLVRRSDLRIEDHVPELARDAEPHLVVLVVVLQVVGLELLEVLGQLRVM